MRVIGAFLAVVVLASPAAADSILRVDARAPAGGDGMTWRTAFNDLQDALFAAAPGDELWIAAGTYAPGPPGGARTSTFTLFDDIALYGGFAGGERALEERDPVANVTILTGDLDGDDETGNPATRDDNAMHVITALDVAIAPRLDGLTVRAGHADGLGDDADGGGLLAQDSALVVHDCRFVDHTAEGRGGGMYVRSGSATITASRFEGNASPPFDQFSGGAGLAIQGSSAEITDCAFVDNVAGRDAGGLLVIASTSSTVTVTNGTFTGNEGVFGGGCRTDGGRVDFIDCTFDGNSAGVGGGAYAYATETTFTRCGFVGNDAETAGGGLYSYGFQTGVAESAFSENTAPRGGAIATSINNLIEIEGTQFILNEATERGGAISIDRSNLVMATSTFIANAAAVGGAMHTYARSFDGTAAIDTCVFVSNVASFGGAVANETITAATLTDCTFEGNLATFEGGAVHNEGSAPEFIDCHFLYNSADPVGGVGGAMANVDGSHARLTACSFTANTAAEGGALANFLFSDPEVTECAFLVNRAPYGAAVHNFVDCAPIFTACEFDSNEAEEAGAAMWSRLCDVTLVDCTIRNGTARRGAGLHDVESATTISGGLFRDNIAQTWGGGIDDVEGSTTYVENATFVENVASAQSGAGISSDDSDLEVVGCTFTDHQKSSVSGDGAGRTIVRDSHFEGLRAHPAIHRRFGGEHLVSTCTFEPDHVALETLGATIVVEDCEFVGNAVRLGGPGSTVRRCTFETSTLRANGIGSTRVEQCTFACGAISTFIHAHAFTVVDCLFDCGGIDLGDNGRADVRDCTMRNGGTAFVLDRDSVLDVVNTLVTHYATAVDAEENLSADFRNCTLDANGALRLRDGATVALWNSIVRGTALDVEKESLLTAAQTNLEWSGGGPYPGPGNIDADPLFADPDGPDGVPGTDDDDYTLLASSPCIDAALNWSLPLDADDLDGDGRTDELIPFDLAGLARVADDPATRDTGCGAPAVVDMGAHEFQGIPAPDVIHPDLTGDGLVNLDDLLVVLSTWGPCDDAPCCLADVNVDRAVNFLDLLQVLTAWDD